MSPNITSAQANVLQTIIDDEVTLVGEENYASNTGAKDNDFGDFYDSSFTMANQGELRKKMISLHQ